VINVGLIWAAKPLVGEVVPRRFAPKLLRQVPACQLAWLQIGRRRLIANPVHLALIRRLFDGLL
jgi:hypothetical protein